MRLIMSGLHMT